MNLFDDLDIEDFTSFMNVSYKKTYTHRFNPESIGFKPSDVDNIRFFRNMFGETRYYLKKRDDYSKGDVWVFKIMSKSNDLLHEEIITDTQIALNIRPFLRKEILKDIIDLDD